MTTNQLEPSITVTTPPSAAASSDPAPGCPRCQHPVRRLYAGEMICPNCGGWELQPPALRSRLVAAWPGRGAWWVAVAEVRR